MLHHRGKEAKHLYARIAPALREVFGTSRPVRFLASSGTGAVEAGIRALPPGRVLALVNGAFGERMARIAETCHHEVDRLEAPLGRVAEPDAVAAKVRAGSYAGNGSGDLFVAFSVANEVSPGSPATVRMLGNDQNAVLSARQHCGSNEWRIAEGCPSTGSKAQCLGASLEGVFVYDKYVFVEGISITDECRSNGGKT